MIQDSIKAIGKLTVKVTGPDGTVKDQRFIDNVVVNVGKAFIASRMRGTTDALMSHMAIGTGTVAAAASQSALGTEVARTALTGTAAATTTVTNDAVQYSALFGPNTPGAPAAVTEAGIFNASSAGTMLCRTKFDPVNKDVADSLAITWTVTIA
jgi:hypothetical protein